MADQRLGITLDASLDISKVLAGVQGMQNGFNKLQIPPKLADGLTKEFDKIGKLIDKYQTQLSKGVNTKTDAKNLAKTGSEIQDSLNNIVRGIREVSETPLVLKVEDATQLKTLENNLKNVKKQIQDTFQQNLSSSGLFNALDKFSAGTGRAKTVQNLVNKAEVALERQELEKFGQTLDAIKTKLSSYKGTTLVSIGKALGLNDLSSNDATGAIERINTRIDELKDKANAAGESVKKLKEEETTAAKAIDNFKPGAIERAKEATTELSTKAEQVPAAFNQIRHAADDAASGILSAKSQVDQLKQSTQYFFSLRNMINLLKRGVREAIDVVKELDAAMTETAVVTDYSVGDMWQKLPEYTANANALGATVKDMYEATTLYYQQGLKTEAAMGIANETMKMARIGGLQASDATDKMTAALRGFNMEINEMSAQRVNDVYSNLAAKTASNTEELGSAMQRTASIAHSAGMSFEGTAAFLAQAIETTREPAENLGTAMKTIVARFTELKKNPLEIAEVDGEEVSYNKVDTALQSIGVSLKDANGQFRDLDKVFLDISKRWDSLTQTQQRYIATTAAGSRQQSRFIAMMSNYERTTQLMDFANNSAGASNEQFGKTMESLAAKLNKLRNAWNEFLMGIMNDSATKFVVDTGTKILDLVNKIIDKLSANGELGLVKSLLSIGTAFTALKAGGNIINKLIGGLGGLVDPTSSFGQGFWGGGKATAEGASATGVAGRITVPIVQKLSELIAVTKTAYGLKNNSGVQVTSTTAQYRAISSGLRNTTSNTIGTISSRFGQLSDEHAYMAYKTSPGTVNAMQQSALGWLSNQNLSAEMQKTGQQLMANIFRGMKKGEIPIKKGMQLIGKPALWGEHFGTDVAQSFSDNYIKHLKAQIPQMEANTAQAHEKALSSMGYDKNNESFAKLFTVGSKEFKTLMSNDNMRDAYLKYFRQFKGELEDTLDKTSVVQQKYQQFGNSVGAFGSKFTSAGYSIQMFGSQLAQLSPALQGVGVLLTKVGGLITTFGYGFAGAGRLITTVGGQITKGIEAARLVKYGNAIGALVNSGQVAANGMIAQAGARAASASGAQVAGGFASGFLSGIPTPLLAAGVVAALAGTIALVKGHLDKKAKEAGEEVRENFEKGFTETNKKIDSLEGYKDRFNELSKGVDQFGHNISLTDEEYDEYLSISRDLQELSPSLIAGYNAEGQAILRKGEAIDEVIDKLKEERDLSLTDYISNDSVEKLIKAYNTSDTYKQHHTTVKDTVSQSATVGAFDSEKSNISKAIRQAGLEWSDFSQILDELGIGGAATINQLTNAQLGLISDHYIDILNKIKEFNPQIEAEAEDGLKEAFAETNNAIEDVLTEGAPIVEALQQWMGQEKLDAVGLGLSEEFVSGFNSGLDGLMLEGLTNDWKPEEYKAQLKDYANEWKNLAGPTSQYSTILTEADKIQQQYLDHIDEDGAVKNYEDNIEGLATQLESLAEQYKGTGAAGEVFAEQCQQQANSLRNYATEGVLTLGEALNTLSDEFASARGAQERFQKATEGGDYYTAAEGYKSIVETVLDDKNKAAGGSLTGWAGADELLGQDFVDNHNWDEIVSQIEKIQSCFDDGADGIIAFNDLLTENADKLEGLGHVGENGFEFDLQNEDLEEYAKVLHMSEDALAALIDKARQWTPINLGDPGKIRKAIEDSQYSMAGVSTKGENLVYTSEAQFRNEARQQGIRGDDYAKTRKDAEERGVRFLNVENLTTKNGDKLYADQVLENIGLKGADKTLDNSVAALAKMGLDLEETKQVLTADGIKLADGEVTEEDVEKAYNENAYAMENPTVAEISNNTGTLVSNTSAMLAAMGVLTEDAKKNIENNTSNDTIKGYTDLLNKEYTNTSDREAARAEVQAKRDEYQETIDLYARGGLTADNNEYIAKLVEARNKLDEALTTEATTWQNKIGEYSQLFSNIGNEFVNEHALDFANAFAIEDINQSAEALRQLEEEGKLTHTEMRTLAAEFMQINQASLRNLDSGELDKLCTKLGLTKAEATGLLDALGEPFILNGRLEGEDLEAYIKNFDGLDDSEKTIFLRTDISGEEKAEVFIDKINNEFGDGDEKKKSVIIEATAEMANGNQEAAEKILSDAGFDEDEVKTITQKLSILVNGSVANPDDVQTALQNELNNLNLTANASVNVKANISKKISKIGTSVDVNTKPIDDAKTKADSTKGTIKVDANTESAKKKIDALKDVGSTTITVNAKKGTGWTQTIDVNVNKHKHGRNYSIPASHSVSFGSAAQGMNLPRKKQTTNSQVTALVGEEGFEVGYIPSESRSVIFGSNGPEITSFPKDTIIYPHNQSKEILRRGKGDHKSLGSFGGGKDSISSGGLLAYIKGGGGGGKDTKKDDKKGKDTKKDDKKDKDTKKIVAKVGKITVWWENMTRRIEATERLAEKNQKKYEKYLAQMKATLYTTGTKGHGNDYIKNLNHEISLYKKEVNRASNALKKYDTSTKKKVTLPSYKENGKSVKVSLSKYISKKDGTYVLNEKAINAVPNSKKRKAIKEAATKKVDDLLSKKYKAEDGIAKAKEELEKFGEQLYKTFFAWEISLNEIWDLTQRIEAAQGKITRTDTMSNLLDAQIKSGMIKADENTAASGIELFKQRLKEQNNIVAERSQAITEAQKAVQNAYSTDDEQKQLKVIQDKLQKDKEARDKRAEAKKRVDDAKQKLANKKKLKSQKKDLQKELKEAKTKKQRDAIQKKINKINKKLKNYRSDTVLKTAIETAQKTYDEVKKQTSGSLLSATQKAGYTEAKEQIKARQEAIAKSQKYGKFTRNADGTFSVDFDTEKLEKDKLAGLISEEQAKFIEEYYTNLIEASKNLDETINSLGEDVIEYYTSLSDLRDEWVDYEDQLIQMSEETNRKQIDNLKKLSDSVKQALDDLINDVKRKLEERRKQEDNAKTERDISRKQQRLAALRADTSGGHQVEIAQLEKEIADAQQDYQRSLEDQLLDKLQQQGDEAAKQRERQIALQEELITSINNIQQVDAWMAELSDENTSEGRKEEIKAQMLEAYRQTHDYDKKGIYGQERIDEEFEAFYQGLTTNQKKQEELRKSIDDLTAVMDRLRVLQEQSGKTPAELAAELAKEGVDAKTMHDTYGLSYSTIRESAGYDAERFAADGVDYKGAKEAFTAYELKNVDEYAEEAKTDSTKIKDTYDKFVKNRGGKNSTDKFKGKIGAAGLKAQLERGRQLGYSEGKVFADLAASDGLTWEKVITAAKDANYNVSKLIAIRDSSNWSNKRKNYFGKAVNKVYKLPQKNSKGQIIQKALKTNFLTGGLADFTGPAWLDGTPSRPELVLNAKDTQNFIALKDVLANAMSGMGDTSNTYGDTLYEININVDKIEKDYDVDRVVKKVKEEITKGAGYRNVTQVRNFR